MRGWDSRKMALLIEFYYGVRDREKIKRRDALQLSVCERHRIYHLVAGASKEIK